MKDRDIAAFGSRLRTARKMAGLSLEDLSVNMGGIVTRQALSKYERGLMMPSPEVFERLSRALDDRPASGPEKPSMTGISSEAMSELAGRRSFRSRRSGEAGIEIAPPWNALETPADGFNNRFVAADSISEPEADYRRSLPFPRVFCSEAAPEPEKALGKIRFRGREKLPAKSAVALRLRVEDYLKRCLELESALGLEQEFSNPLVNCDVRTPADVEEASLGVRRAWDLGSAPVTNLLGLLEEKGVRVFELRGIQGFEGLSGNYGPGPGGASIPFVAVNRDFPDDRLRFTAAHELGHLLCGFEERESAESLCHAFAAAFLLPRSALERALMPSRRKVSLWELWELKETYGISLQAIVYRARSLGLVTDRQVRNFRGTMRANGWLVTEPVEYRGSERASRLRRLLSYAVAEAIIPPERAAALAGVSPAEFLGTLGNVF